MRALFKLFILLIPLHCKPPSPKGAHMMSMSGKKTQKCPITGSTHSDGFQTHYVLSFESTENIESIENVKLSKYINKNENGSVELGPENGQTYPLKKLQKFPGVFVFQNPQSQNHLFKVEFQENGKGWLFYQNTKMPLINWTSCKSQIGS